MSQVYQRHKANIVQLECHSTPQHADALRSHDFSMVDTHIWECHCGADLHEGTERYSPCNAAGMADPNAKQEHLTYQGAA